MCASPVSASASISRILSRRGDRSRLDLEALARPFLVDVDAAWQVGHLASLCQRCCDGNAGGATVVAQRQALQKERTGGNVQEVHCTGCNETRRGRSCGG